MEIKPKDKMVLVDYETWYNLRQTALYEGTNVKGLVKSLIDNHLKQKNEKSKTN